MIVLELRSTEIVTRGLRAAGWLAGAVVGLVAGWLAGARGADAPAASGLAGQVLGRFAGGNSRVPAGPSGGGDGKMIELPSSRRRPAPDGVLLSLMMISASVIWL